MNTNSNLTNIILDSNSSFSPINENATILVENIASNVLYRTEYAKVNQIIPSLFLSILQICLLTEAFYLQLKKFLF
jgi:hypothetical protein